MPPVSNYFLFFLLLNATEGLRTVESSAEGLDSTNQVSHSAVAQKRNRKYEYLPRTFDRQIILEKYTVKMY